MIAAQAIQRMKVATLQIPKVYFFFQAVASICAYVLVLGLKNSGIVASLE